MIRVSPFRFFLRVVGTPWWMLAGLAAAVLAGLATLTQDPREVDSALALVLLLQMFAAATGFKVTASRGYFDPVLVAGRPRWTIALANLAAAVLPGVIAWLLVVTVAAVAGGGDRVFEPHRHVALLIVSSVAWALGIAMPRMAPGVIWCAALLTLAISRGATSDALALVHSAPGGVTDALAVSGACLLCPFLLLGDLAGPRSAAVLGILLGVATVAAFGGAQAICRHDCSLRETL